MRSSESKNGKLKAVQWKITKLLIGEIAKNSLFLIKSDYLAFLSIFILVVFHPTGLNLTFLVSLALILQGNIFSNV